MIWGYLFYQIFDALYADTPTMPVINNTTAFPPAKEQQGFEFELLPLEEDPFLGSIYKKDKASSPVPKTSSNNSTTPWPVIVFHGLVSDGKQKQNVYVISINSVQYLLKKGQESNGVTLVGGNSDAVFLKFKGNTKEFPRI